MSSYIIGFIVFAAFARAAREYRKNPVAWGAIGLAAFFVPQFLIALVGGAILGLVGAPGALSVLLIADFVISAAITAWAYNKMMNRAIREMATLDAIAAGTPQTSR